MGIRLIRASTKVCQRPSHQTTGEGYKLGTGLKVLPVLAGFGEELEAVVLQHVHTLVVCPQVVDLLSALKFLLKVIT